jgi:tetratricopeptide (TPR) repeat protein
MSFVNRVKERRDLSSIMRQVNEDNCVIVLSGTTGVGKSGLAQYLLENEMNFKTSVCVHISKSSPDSIENSHYLNAIYRKFCEYAKEHKAVILSPIEHALSYPASLLHIAKEWLKNKAGLPEGSKLYEPPFEHNLVQKKDYIVDFLKDSAFIIDIDNIQNIDVVSLEILVDIIKSVKNTVFIFEYTTEAGKNDNLLSFINEIKAVCMNTRAYTITQLPFTEAKQLAPSDVKINDDVLFRIYSGSNGNLMQIILANQLICEQHNSIQSTLANLNQDEKYITYLIYWNGGRINKNYLTMISTCSYTDGALVLLSNRLQMTVDSLIEKKVIREVKYEGYEIVHDSIIEELEHTSLNPQLFIAYHVVKNYLIELLDISGDSSIVDTLFTLFVKQGDTDLISILPQIQKNIRQSKYPQNAISKLMFYQSKLEVQGIVGIRTSQIIYEQLAATCNDLGLAEYAQELLDHVYNPKDPYHIALQASIYGWQCNCDAIDKIIEKHNEKSRLNLAVRLCKLTAAMMSKPRKESVEIAITLMDEYADSDYLECAFLLRNYAELVDDMNEAINQYERSIRIFTRFDREDLIAECHLSLAMIYAYLADLDEARNQLHLANEMSDMINESCLLNNYAVLDILSDHVDDAVQKRLSDALLINGNEYDRLIIMCNLLVCYTKMGKVDQAGNLCQLIEDSSYKKFQYDEFLHIVFSNLLYYYQSIGVKNKADYYIDQLKGVLARQHVSTFVSELTNNLLYRIPSNQFYAKFPFRVDFLGYWVFRIDSGLRNCGSEFETCPHKSSF